MLSCKGVPIVSAKLCFTDGKFSTMVPGHLFKLEYKNKASGRELISDLTDTN